MRAESGIRRDDRARVLFLCTGNSCRSQMAEGWCRHLFADSIAAYSAGVEAQGINPLAARVMAEAGVDISAQQSVTLDRYREERFDLVVTVCDHAHDHCPAFKGSRILHRKFDDPPRMAASLPDENQQLDCYRRVRDQIRHWVDEMGGQFQTATETEGNTTC